ncbi:MAG: hypothetical protein J5870_05790 [Clostridia bacterium]|nr:hypothetical protein [Clostridia bacterium]MBR5772887.1 hypothetical protein [Clostridia bacterium]
MKKLLALITVFALVFSFAACGKNTGSGPEETGTSPLAETEESSLGSLTETALPAENEESSEPEPGTVASTTIWHARATMKNGENSASTSQRESRVQRPGETSPSGYDDWGLKMTFDCTDGKKGTITFRQSMEAGSPGGEIITGEPYTLQAKDGDGWYTYESYVRKHYDPDYSDVNPTFIMVAYTIPPNGEYKMDVDFTSVYGQLKPGTYRITKTVTSGGGFNRASREYSAEFTVE